MSPQPARRRGLTAHLPPSVFEAGRWLGLALALVILNFALTFHNVWPTLWITTHYELSVELAVLLLVLALAAERHRDASPRLIGLLAAVLLLFALGRYAEVTAPALYGRRVNLYWDGPHLLNVGAMLETAAARWQIALLATAAIGFLLLLFLLLRFSLRQVAAALAEPAPRRVVLGLSAALVGLYAIGYLPTPLKTLRWFSIPVTATYWQQAEFTLAAYRQAHAGNAPLCAQAPLDADLSRLGGDDVLLLFMESYGATSYDRAEIAATVVPARDRYAAAVAASGRSIVSAFVTSPTFGGASWLAHVTLLTGRSIRDNGTYDLLLTQDCEVLTRTFARGGYRVVGAMPGLKREWPEGEFYGFDALYGERALDYHGPEFGWWRIPDQYSLAKVDALELAPTERLPVFLFFPTISSHMPFRPTPPLAADDAQVLSAAPFAADAVAANLAMTPNWTDLGPDYAATLAYTFDYLAAYVRSHADRDFVLVTLGDHQPASSVSGEGARWDVPVHVVTNRPALLEALLAAGFVRGVEPATDPIGPMEKLTGLLAGTSAGGP